METDTKLKQTRWTRIIILSVLAIAVFFTGFAFIRAFFSNDTANKITGIIYFLITIVLLFGFLRVRHSVYIPVILLNMSTAITFLINMEKAMIIPNILFLVFCAYVFYFFFRHISLKRKILELAARPVSRNDNGFTGRPYPVGKISFTKGELHGFSGLMKKLIIAVPLIEKNGISFYLPDDWFGHIYGLSTNNAGESKVTFQYDGNVSVFISENDYKKYKDELTLYQLCNSLGDLYISFFSLFNEGKGDLIMQKIKRMDN